MKKIIAKKQKNKPFDYAAAESFRLNGEEDDTVNNSYYFSAHGVQSGESLYCRLGLRNSHAEVWFYYAKENKRYCLKQLLFEKNAPLTVCREGGEWRVTFNGTTEDESGKEVDAQFCGVFSSTAEPVDFFCNMPPVRTAKAMAFEKWDKAFFAEVQKNNQVHYEQTGVLRGVLTLDGEKYKISLPCVRDHSYGKRDWNYMNNHLWLMAICDESQLNFSMVSYPAMTLLEVGNFKRGNDPMAYVLKAEYDRDSVARGTVPAKLSLKLHLDDKSAIEIEADKIDEETYLFQNGEYRLIECIAQFTIEGKPYRGIVEMGFNEEKSRWFNGKEIKKLKS